MFFAAETGIYKTLSKIPYERQAMLIEHSLPNPFFLY